ncbi:hypothetical protein [Rubritalea tangerina]
MSVLLGKGDTIYTISRLGIDAWSVVQSCEVCAKRFQSKSDRLT